MVKLFSITWTDHLFYNVSCTISIINTHSVYQTPYELITEQTPQRYEFIPMYD